MRKEWTDEDKQIKIPSVFPDPLRGAGNPLKCGNLPGNFHKPLREKERSVNSPILRRKPRNWGNRYYINAGEDEDRSGEEDGGSGGFLS